MLQASNHCRSFISQWSYRRLSCCCPSFGFRWPKVFPRWVRKLKKDIFFPILINHMICVCVFKQVFPENVVKISRSFNDINILRRLAAILTVGIVGVSNLVDMYMCASSFEAPFANTTTISKNVPLNATHTSNRTLNGGHFASAVCTLFPSYYSNYAILILIATSMVSQLTHICKFCLMLVLAGNVKFDAVPIKLSHLSHMKYLWLFSVCPVGMHCYMNIFQLNNHFKIEEQIYAPNA